MSRLGGWEGAGLVALKAVVFYLYVIVLLRVAGKRTMAKMTVFDFASTVAMATIIGSTIISPSIPLTNGVAGLTVLVGMQWLLAWVASRNARFHKLITNSPKPLYTNSRFLVDNLRQERVSENAVLAKAREAGHADMSTVDSAILETTGDVSVIPIGLDDASGSQGATGHGQK